MFDFMDSKFNMRRILINNLCWIILLSFQHIGVNCQTLEITGSEMINSMATFNCTMTSANQFYAEINRKDGVRLTLITQVESFNNDINKNYVDRINITTMKLGDNTISYIMNLDNLQCTDEAEYSCNVNMMGDIKEAENKLVVNSPPHTPTLTAPTNDVVRGDIVTLECTANVGKPAKNLKLCVRQEQGFNCSEASTLVDLGNCSSTRTVQMTVNITEDTYEATCEVVGESNLKVSGRWIVLFPISDLKLVPGSSEVSPFEGEGMEVTCQARGKPGPSYDWEFQPETGDTRRLLAQQKLSLSDVHLSQAGEYTCIATNTIRNVTYNMTKSVKVTVVPTTPAPTTTIATTTLKTSTGGGNGTGVRPAINDKKDDWKLIVGIVCAILFLIILIALLVILYRRRSKPVEIEEPPEKPRNNHEVNMKDTKPDLVYSTGIEKQKLPMYNTGFDHNGEDDLYYAELAFDDKPRSRKPIVPLNDYSSSNDPYTTVMPQV